MVAAHCSLVTLACLFVARLCRNQCAPEAVKRSTLLEHGNHLRQARVTADDPILGLCWGTLLFTTSTSEHCEGEALVNFASRRPLSIYFSRMLFDLFLEDAPRAPPRARSQGEPCRASAPSEGLLMLDPPGSRIYA